LAGGGAWAIFKVDKEVTPDLVVGMVLVEHVGMAKKPVTQEVDQTYFFPLSSHTRFDHIVCLVYQPIKVLHPVLIEIEAHAHLI
jgi:hypothetical protein